MNNFVPLYFYKLFEMAEKIQEGLVDSKTKIVWWVHSLAYIVPLSDSCGISLLKTKTNAILSELTQLSHADPPQKRTAFERQPALSADACPIRHRTKSLSSPSLWFLADDDMIFSTNGIGFRFESYNSPAVRQLANDARDGDWSRTLEMFNNADTYALAIVGQWMWFFFDVQI